MSKKRISRKERETILLIGIAMIFISFISFLSLGPVGNVLRLISVLLFGKLYVLSYCIILFVGIYLLVYFFNNSSRLFNFRNTFGIVLLFCSVLTLLSLPKDRIAGIAAFDNYWNQAKVILDGTLPDIYSGGVIGNGLYALFSSLVDYIGAIVVSVIFVLVSIYLIIGKNGFVRFFNLFKFKVKKPAIKHEAVNIKVPEVKFFALNNSKKPVQGSYVIEEESEEIEEPEIEESVEEYNEGLNAEGSGQAMLANDINNSYRKYKNYTLPSYRSLLDKTVKTNGSLNRSAAIRKGELLIEVLRNFSIDADLVKTYVGPTVTKFEIKPDVHVNVNKVVNLSDNIKMALAAQTLRIEAPIPGKSGIGVEIPNEEITTVQMKEVLDQMPNEYKEKPLAVVLGKDLFDEPVYCDLQAMPHLLVAGATGSGKSVCMNAIICSLLLKSNPYNLKLVLIDPKKVEFRKYADIPHLATPIVDDASKATRVLKVLVDKMEERYQKFANAGVSTIEDYNNYVKKYNLEIKEGEIEKDLMPYIVIIIDELADLMLVAKKDVQMYIQRITQLARAAGMHLVVATQRPSTDVITGVIKANIPSRIAFAVSNGVDSRVVLDQVGAENLLGKGDMLYSPAGKPATRVQGVYLTNKEQNNIAEAVKKKAEPVYEDDLYMASADLSTESDGIVKTTEKEKFISDIMEYIVTTKKASTSSLERRFGIGYNRAARIIDLLEARHIIGPANGSKPREIYITMEDLKKNEKQD